MTAITNALLYGYPSRVILDSLMKKYPQYANQIQQAQAAGYTSDMILRHLSGKKGYSPQDSEQFLTEHERTRNRQDKDQKRARLLAIGALGTAGALVAAGASLTSRNKAIYPSEIVKTNVPKALPAPNQTKALTRQPLALPPPGPINPGGNPPIPPVNPPPVNPSPISPKPQVAPVSSPPDFEKSLKLIRNLNEEARFSNVASSDKFDLKTKADILRKILPKDKLPALEKAEGGLEKVVDDYSKFLKQTQQTISKEKPQTNVNVPAPKTPDSVINLPFTNPINQAATPIQNPTQPQTPQPVQPPLQNLSPPTEASKNITNVPKEIFKKVVVTPKGVGEVKYEGNKNVVTNVGGQDKSYFKEDITKPSEEIIQAVEQILQIPEVDRSSVVSLFTYDPSENKMYIQFHTGDTYKYMDVDPEKVYAVANKLGIPVTSGKNVFGAWSPEDKNSLGAALIQQIIKDPKYAKPKKGEPPNPNFQKLETLFDYWSKLRKPTKKRK